MITVMLEAMLPKRRILELYLNVIEWGNGVFGAEAAARRYFGVSAAQLSAEQAARLAAMTPNPRCFERNPGLRVSRRPLATSSRGCRRRRCRSAPSQSPAAFPRQRARRMRRTPAHRSVERGSHRACRLVRAPHVRHRRREVRRADRARANACRTRSPRSPRCCASTGWSKGWSTSRRASDGARRRRGELAESVVTRQNKAALQRKLDRLHPADIAYILEALPLDERLYIWDLVRRDARRRDPARGLRRGPRIAHLVDGHRGARRRRPRRSTPTRSPSSRPTFRRR